MKIRTRMQTQQQPSPSGRPIGGFIGSSSMSGASNRTSPMGGSPASNNKSVAFNKPPSTVIPVDNSPTSMGGSMGNPSSQSRGSGQPQFPPGSVSQNNMHLGNVNQGSMSTHQSLLRVGPRLRAEGLMVPPASDAATLRRQVAALQMDLEAHIDGETRLQSINQELRERLELYMKQNHENVERAETELNTLHEDMEQTLDLQRRLAQRAQVLEREKKDMENSLQKRLSEFETERAMMQMRISAMGEEVREKSEAQTHIDNLKAELNSALSVKDQLQDKLVVITEEATYLKQRSEQYTDELRNLILKEQKDQRVERAGTLALERRFFVRFQEGVRDQCIDKANELTAQKHYDKKIAKLGWQTFKMAIGRACLIKRHNKRQSQQILEECWKAWRLAAVVTRKCVEALKRQAEVRASHTLHSWVAYVIRARRNPERYQIAINHWNHTVLRKALNVWRSILRASKLNEDQEHNMSKVALVHWKIFRLRRMMAGWKDWLRTYARPKRSKMAAVQAHINKMTMKQAMSAWRCMVRMKWLTRMKFEEASEQNKRWIRKRTLTRLKEAMKEIWIERKIMEQGMKFRKLRQGNFVVKTWKLFVQEKHHMQIRRQMAFRHYLCALRKKIFKSWRDNVIYQKAQMRAITEVNQCLTRAAMVFWRDHHVYHSIKRKKEKRADVHKKRRELKNAKKLLLGWWDQMAWKRRAVQLDCLLAIRRRRTLLVSSLHSWMHATFDGLLLANAKFHDDLLEAQVQFEEQKHQVTTVDVENLQLIDRLHSMSAEIAYLKTTISEKERAEEELHRAVEDAAVLESSMRGEIEQQHIRAEELVNDNHALQKRIHSKNAEDTAGEVHHTLELQNMEQALQELRIQLAERTSQLDSYEKCEEVPKIEGLPVQALKETAEKLEGASDESQEKLTSAFEIAGSLRKLLEDRDNQFATLEGNTRRRELELGEVQRKLAVANCTLCETVESRDTRISELETMLSQKQSEVLEAQQQLQDLELALDAKDSRVRKLEYEIKLISEPNAIKAKKFVSSLSSFTPTPVGRPTVVPITRPTNLVQTSTQPTPTQQTPLQREGFAAPRLHSLEIKDSMRHAYAQAKRALQQSSASSDDGGSGLRSAEPESSRGIQDIRSPREQGHPESLHAGEAARSPPSRQADDPTTAADTATHSLYFQAQDTSQPDWETSFALVSTTRPASTGGGSEPSYATSELGQEDRRGDSAVTPTVARISEEGGPFRTVLEDDRGAVDSLHIEIQRLQARIMSRLRDSPLQAEERDRRTPRPQQPGPPNARRPS